MLYIDKHASIYFYSLPVDLRKGFEGLSSIASSIINDSSIEIFFVFLNRKRNRIKILHRASENLSYWFIRSRKGVFAPKKTQTSLISLEELNMILNGKFPNRLMAVQNDI
jgi:hypothetical protein